MALVPSGADPDHPSMRGIPREIRDWLYNTMDEHGTVSRGDPTKKQALSCRELGDIIHAGKVKSVQENNGIDKHFISSKYSPKEFREDVYNIISCAILTGIDDGDTDGLGRFYEKYDAWGRAGGRRPGAKESSAAETALVALTDSQEKADRSRSADLGIVTRSVMQVHDTQTRREVRQKQFSDYLMQIKDSDFHATVQDWGIVSNEDLVAMAAGGLMTEKAVLVMWEDEDDTALGAAIQRHFEDAEFKASAGLIVLLKRAVLAMRKEGKKKAADVAPAEPAPVKPAAKKAPKAKPQQGAKRTLPPVRNIDAEMDNGKRKNPKSYQSSVRGGVVL